MAFLSRQRASRGNWAIELLEVRRLLAQSVAVDVEYSPAFPYVSGEIEYRIPTGYQTTVSGGVARAAVPGETPAPDGTQITGSVSIEWYQGPVIATIPLQNTDFIDPDPEATIQATGITLNEADAGTPIASGAYAGDYVLIAVYSGDPNFNATAPFDYTTHLSDYGLDALSYGVNVIRFTGGISFKTQPASTEAGEPIKPPIEVAVMNQNGLVNTSSNDQVQLSIHTGASSDLAGTVTAKAVHGVATFKNVSINTSGAYTLTATDITNGDLTTSGAFTVSPAKLTFAKQPSPVSITEAVNPDVKVELKNGKNQIVKSANGTVITLTPVGASYGEPLSGNTATLVNGVAIFSDLTFSDPGVYELQASDGTDVAVTSMQFKVSPLHLAFTREPTSTRANTPLTFTVSLEDVKNKVLKTNSSTTIEVQAVSIATGDVDTLSGGVLLTDGVAVFNASDPVSLDSADSYNLLATPIDGNGVPLVNVSSALSKKLVVK